MNLHNHPSSIKATLIPHLLPHLLRPLLPLPRLIPRPPPPRTSLQDKHDNHQPNSRLEQDAQRNAIRARRDRRLLGR